MKMKSLMGGAIAGVMCLGLVLTGCGSSQKEESQATDSSPDTVTGGQAEADAQTEKTDGDYEEVKILLGKESLCLGPIHIAIENGYLDEEFASIGQEYELVEAEVSQAAELIASGQINAAYGLTASFMEPISNGLNITFTTGLHTGCTKYYVKPDSGIDSLEDLKGKTVGVPALSDSSVINLKRKLADVGLDVTSANPDVEFVAYSMTDLPAALDNDGVDAVGLHDPVATTAEEEFGFTKILDTGEDEKFVDEYCCQAFVETGLIESNPDGAAAYTRALQKAAAFIQAEPYEAAKIQVDKGYITGDPGHNGQILESLNYTPSVSLGKQTFVNAFADLQKIGLLDASLDADEFTAKATAALDGVPDTIYYDSESGTFSEKSAEASVSTGKLKTKGKARNTSDGEKTQPVEDDCCEESQPVEDSCCN